MFIDGYFHCADLTGFTLIPSSEPIKTHGDKWYPSGFVLVRRTQDGWEFGYDRHGSVAYGPTTLTIMKGGEKCPYEQFPAN